MMGTDEADQRQAAQVRTQGSNTFSPQEPANRKEQGDDSYVCAHPSTNRKLCLQEEGALGFVCFQGLLPPLLHMAWGQGASQSLRYHVLKSLWQPSHPLGFHSDKDTQLASSLNCPDERT